MADLESRIEHLEKELPEIKKQIGEIQDKIHGSLSDIKNDVVEIKQLMKDTTKIDDLKNAVINKDVERNTARISKLEDNQNKLVWTIVIEVIGLIGAAVIAYLKMS